MLSRILIRAAAALALLGAVAAQAAGVGADQGAAPTARAEIQYLLRRFAFAAAPETVDKVLAEKGGATAWLDQQLAWSELDDTGSTLETLPTRLNADGGYDDPDMFERVVVQHMLRTPRQLQAKLELHWLDHFSVSANKVSDPAVMEHYDRVVRAGALGNFTTLLTAVAKEAAMMWWLDNDGNVGPVANENFARECMQLYTMGPVALNPDGSARLDGAGQPVANYSQADVQAIAKAVTGYAVIWNWNDNNPQSRFSVQFTPQSHDTATLHFKGKTYAIPDDASAIDHVMAILARDPSTAPFQAKELLQRFVTETPSPRYVSDIAAVWAATVDKPDQIAQVVRAIATHPEFDRGYRAMLKQPLELTLGMLRQLPGRLQAKSGYGPAESLLWVLSDIGQEPYYPPSVFSFYRPGAISTIVNTATRMLRTDDFAWLTDGTPDQGSVTAWVDIPTLRQRIGSTEPARIAAFLLDALVDGGTPEMQLILQQYLESGPSLGHPSDDQIRGAIWILLNAPVYAVN